MRINWTAICVLAGVLMLALNGCKVGPDFEKPNAAAITPVDWRWKIAEPSDEVPKGDWWKIFNDPVLDELELSAVSNNQNLRAAVARVDEARAAARITRSQLFPTIAFDPAFQRQRTSGNMPTFIPIDFPAAYFNSYSVPLDLSYEVDLWGRVRRSFEAAQADAQANVADYQNVLLTLTADVAVNYFLLRSFDRELETLRRTIVLREQSVRILSERFAVGVILEVDVAQAKTELASAKVELEDVAQRREESFNALALLCGKPPASLELKSVATLTPPVVVPPGLPASLLERRPDIARAQRNVASSNARIGVAKAAYFPALSLTGQAGFLSAEAQDIFSADSRVWSIGPSISLPVFNAGRTKSEVKQAEAAYEATVAQYRQTILTAFKEVEDSLSAIVLRDRQILAQAEALVSAQRVAELAKARYEAGNGNYLEYVDAQRTLLTQERRETQIAGQRLTANVQLIKALGGGW